MKEFIFIPAITSHPRLHDLAIHFETSYGAFIFTVHYQSVRGVLSITMRRSSILFLFLAVLAFAAPRPQGTNTCIESSKSYSSTTTLTINATLTFTRTYTHTVTPDPHPTSASSTSSSPPALPTRPYTIISACSGSPVHLLPMNAAGFRFHLGGSSASYCPTAVTEGGGKCPPGNATALLGTCSLVSSLIPRDL